MRVSDLLENLQNQEVKLTLPNIASITEQQLGGFLCNGIHGSGIGFGSFDELVEKMWVAVPNGEFAYRNIRSTQSTYKNKMRSLGEEENEIFERKCIQMKYQSN